ncbi:TetR/AcrR family transcriptional regulator [Sphingopyxis granuli]|uniref:TetR/AcrR family transcriptional regulator n=1 Tax=Sphingopyxis granuli TaxID=267128 RepID=UPI001BAF3C43|nr:TetR/AcrR family transcriptional regulator [Sphingopyxis granuli]QUM70710.1 TetR/AcrR family transcriptional regulator [Sphingopyxis granuli]
MESRILEAAIALYGQQGWRGFNFDLLSKAARVGKDALYRRWPTRSALLNDALRGQWVQVGAIDEGSLRVDLLALGRAVFDAFTGPYGTVALYLRADTQSFPEVREFADPWREYMVQQGRAIVQRAVARSEIPATTPPALILDILIGAVINHVVSTPERLRGRMTSRFDEFVTSLVDLIVMGVTRPVPEDQRSLAG